VGELGAHHLGGTDGGAHHGLVDHDIELDRVVPAEPELAGHDAAGQSARSRISSLSAVMIGSTPQRRWSR
jgi:hypothetical protein